MANLRLFILHELNATIIFSLSLSLLFFSLLCALHHSAIAISFHVHTYSIAVDFLHDCLWCIEWYTELCVVLYYWVFYYLHDAIIFKTNIPYKLLRKIKVASHQSDCPFYLRSDVMLGDLETCKH